ncbi:MAG: amidase [Acidimicrobiia bacterium]|nr:amidase [Acidimicrobiia bacterium]
MGVDRVLLRRPVAELAADVRRGALAARELVGASLAAIEQDDEVLGAFLAVDAEAALAAAAAIDERVAAGEEVGALAGIPLAVKDTEDAAGFITTIGSSIHRDDPVARTDSLLVARLRAAGCVVVGKTNTPEHAWKGDTTNAWGHATHNPWSLERSAGGSSGGSAAAVAAGLVPMATGSDGGGSIRIPAAVNGLTGFKPSLGRIPAGGPHPPGWLDLSSKGVMTRRIADAAPGLDTAIGPDPTDLRSLPLPDTRWSASLDSIGVPLRVAWSPDLGFARVDREILEVCERAVAGLADRGAEVTEVRVWDHDPLSEWFRIVGCCNERTLEALRDTDQWGLVDPGLALTADVARGYTATDVIRALDGAHLLNLALVELFGTHSVLLCPTVAGQTPRLGAGGGLIDGVEDANWVQLTYGFNLTRSPAGSVCAGFTSDSMPVGLQVVGPQHGDVVVLRTLAALEASLDLDTVPPAYR